MKTKAGNYFTFGRALRGVAAILSLILSQHSLVQAEEVPEAYTMMAIANTAQGNLVTKGEFSDAIQNLAATKLRPAAFEAHNNLCVSYTKTGDLEKAAVACDAAVAARADLTSPAVRRLAMTKRQIMRDKAIALSNRGVLRAIVGDFKGARDDFTSSVKLDKRLTDPRANLNYLGMFVSSNNATARNTG